MALVFGYGSLAPDGGTPARLRGFRRAWNVAMDNRVTIPGYKYYVDEAGERPDVYVTFLDLVPGKGVDGFVLEVGDLDALDAREQNYDRVDVTASVDADVEGQVWTYLGSAAGRGRFETGREEGSAVVVREYLETVIGVAAPPAMLPVIDLTRVDLP
jgi:hypothetical protein